ncbi:hypothetical protein JTE90_012793 [Oedothorax gibbosus]|uniref:Zinc finger HIT domain-containing protein 3 n=1 Tax=Oedothorax gibbosus TaxID=931172 RepID=A0AAV6W078_9ARAC|nr:hypothetical protein JTE90_012793 [Oedothorax gibbosus]
MIQGNCEVCKENASKYKCPVCVIKFCSVVCFKTHKESDSCVKPEPVEEKPSNDSEPVIQFETEDTVRTEKLNLLGLDKKVRGDLENQHLRRMLEHLNGSKNPNTDIEEAMKEPIFSEFVTHCLKVVEDE